MLEVGKIINTHGLRGEVKVVTWTDVPEDFENIKKVSVKKGSEVLNLTVARIKYQKNNLIVKFKEVDTIEEAESFKNCILTAEKDELPPLPEGVYYVADLIGCTVYDSDGTEIGVVKDVFTAGAGNVYDVKSPDGKQVLVPANDGTVVSTDIVSKKIIMNIPEGLDD